METRFYLPVLKSRLGEFTGLENLDAKLKSLIYPLFEVTPLEWDQTERQVPKTWEAHLDSFCRKILRKWPFDNCFIDVRQLGWEGSDNTHRIEYIFGRLSEKNIIPYPVLFLSSTDEFLVAVKTAMKEYDIREFGIRVTPNDVTAFDIAERLRIMISSFGVKPEQCHMILDLADARFDEVDNIADSVAAILEDFPDKEGWKSFTVAGAAFPASNLIREGTSIIMRNEWRFYRSLIAKLQAGPFSRHLNYGDYGIVNPGYFQFNPKLMTASANIRYTFEDKWLVVKGRALKHSSDYNQYVGLAKEVVMSGHYLGASYSRGDLHLARCVADEEGPGSPSVWSWVGNNHHFVKVLSDLSAMHSAFSNN